MKVNNPAFSHLLQWISKMLIRIKHQFPHSTGTFSPWNGARGKSYVSVQMGESTKGALNKRLLLLYGPVGRRGEGRG